MLYCSASWLSAHQQQQIRKAAHSRKELEDNPAIKRLEDMIHHLGKDKKVTLLFGAKDETHNQAAILKEYLDSKDN